MLDAITITITVVGGVLGAKLGVGLSRLLLGAITITTGGALATILKAWLSCSLLYTIAIDGVLRTIVVLLLVLLLLVLLLVLLADRLLLGLGRMHGAVGTLHGVALGWAIGRGGMDSVVTHAGRGLGDRRSRGRIGAVVSRIIRRAAGIRIAVEPGVWRRELARDGCRDGDGSRWGSSAMVAGVATSIAALKTVKVEVSGCDAQRRAEFWTWTDGRQAYEGGLATRRLWLLGLLLMVVRLLCGGGHCRVVNKGSSKCG